VFCEYFRVLVCLTYTLGGTHRCQFLDNSGHEAAGPCAGGRLLSHVDLCGSLLGISQPSNIINLETCRS